MTAHNHSTHVEGCYRCELGLDEVTGLTNTTAREYEAFTRGHAQATEDAKEQVADLQERIRRAVETMLSMAAVPDDRLMGKIQGVRLVGSYVDEVQRFYD